MGDNFDEIGRKKDVELKALEVLMPHFNHVNSNVIAYASTDLIRYNHNKIVQCCIQILKNQGKVILTIWEIILGFIMFSKLKDMLVAFLVDVPFTSLPLKSKVRKISCVYVASMLTTKGYFVMEPNACSENLVI
jgi:hypothetical protein